jgi:hypothetical protein
MVSVLAGHGNHLSTSLRNVETPRPRSKLFHLPFSGQHSPPPDPSSLPDHILEPSRLPPRPYKGLNSILSHYTSLPSLWTAIPSAIGLARDIILFHSHAIPLFLLWTAHPPAICPISSLLSLIPDWPTQSTGLLYNRDPVALGSLIPDDGGSTYL